MSALADAVGYSPEGLDQQITQLCKIYKSDRSVQIQFARLYDRKTTLEKIARVRSGMKRHYRWGLKPDSLHAPDTYSGAWEKSAIASNRKFVRALQKAGFS